MCRGLEEKKREEKKERYYEECAVGTCNPFIEYNKDEAPVDVATSLVVNYVNLGALYLFMLYLCLWLC